MRGKVAKELRKIARGIVPDGGNAQKQMYKSLKKEHKSKQ